MENQYFNNPIVPAVITSVIVTLVIVGAGAYAVYLNRATLFNQFAQQYTQSLTSATSTAGSVNKAVTQNVFTEESRIVTAVEQARPSVVSVVVNRDVPVVKRQYEQFRPFGPDGPAFRIPRYQKEGTQQQQVGSGSGFIVSADGLVVTNKHVVSAADASYTVLTNDGAEYGATVLAKDPVFDIAVLKLTDASAGGLNPLTFGDSSTLKPGQTVIAIGNALGEFRNSVSKGIISGLSRSITARDGAGSAQRLDEVIQTDAAINPGNSGGPLLDSTGHVIGVNVAMARGSENIGFALPSNLVKDIVRSVREHGEITRPFLGIRYVMITERIAAQNDLSVDHGALIVSGDRPEQLAVVPGSPADIAGLEENDIILSINGTDVTPERPLATLIRRQSVGDEITIEVLHDGERKMITATLTRTP